VTKSSEIESELDKLTEAIDNPDLSPEDAARVAEQTMVGMLIILARGTPHLQNALWVTTMRAPHQIIKYREDHKRDTSKGK